MKSVKNIHQIISCLNTKKSMNNQRAQKKYKLVNNQSLIINLNFMRNTNKRSNLYFVRQKVSDNTEIDEVAVIN